MGIDQVRAAFLDRDGVLNANVFYDDTGAWESPRTVAAFALLPGILSSLQRLQEAGFLLFLVSNQPNAVKGKSTRAELDAIQAELARQLDRAGICFAEFFYCFHHPEFGGACECRKPSPYFLLEAAARYSIDLRRSWMVGDRLSDIACGRNAGTQTILITGEPPAAGTLSDVETPTAMVADLAAAVPLVLGSSLVG